MKKLLFLMLSAAVAVSASAGITSSKLDKTIKQQKKARTERVTRASGISYTGKNLKAFDGTFAQRPAMFRGANITWDFEDEAQLEGWAIIDADGDGYNWSYSDTVLTAHSGDCCLFSNSYVNGESGGGTALTPDNWLISPQVELGGGVEVWAVGQDASYAAEVFAIYACVGEPTTTADFVKISPDFTTTGEYARYSASLAAFEGQMGCFAIRHYNVTDQFILNIDDIRIAPDVEVDHYSVVPQNVTVTPGSDNAYVAWDDTEEDAYNLRWRPWVDLSGNPIDCDFSLEDYSEDLEGWASLMANDTSEGWYLAYSNSSTQDDACLASDSYGEAGALTPDNWMISPLTKLQGQVSFKAWHRSSYAEKLEILVGYEDAIEGNIVYTDQFTNVYSLTTTANSKASAPTYTVDLSEYNGQKGYVVFRHYGTTDQWTLYVDDIFIGDPNAEVVEPAAWVEVNGLVDPNYTINGLTPETQYEVQVQAVYNNNVTDWSDIVGFTTLPESNNVYIIGEVNDKEWASNDGVQMTFDEENNVYTATVTFDGRNDENGEEVNYFALTKKLADDWAIVNENRLGSETEGDFWVTPDLMGQELGLQCPYEMAYRIAKGEYKLTVDLEAMTLVIEDLNPAPQGLRGDVDMNEEVGIADVSALIDYLLTGDATGISLQNADCDLSGVGTPDVTIADVSALIDYLLNGAW